jgi:molybdenum cofactor cytidylyltransferase
VATMKLHDVMRLYEPCRVAVVGAGGKTSTILRLAESFKQDVVITTTTHLGMDQIEKAEQKYFVSSIADLEQIDWGNLPRIVSITGPAIDGHRLGGLSPENINFLYERSIEHHFSILIEADGSRMLPLKAPAEHEPVIPEWVDAVIVLAGISALGKPLSSDTVFRPELFGKLGMLKEGEVITVEGLERVLCHPKGGLKGIPEKAKRILVLNQAEDVKMLPEVMRIANNCKDIYNQVLITAVGYQHLEPVVLARVEHVAAIILAAGGSSRMEGKPKPLVEFQGETLIERAVKTAANAGFNPVIVVTGYKSDLVISKLAGMNIEIVENSEWNTGQSSSIQAGLRKLGGRCGATFFMLVDQPFVSVELLEKLKNQLMSSMIPIIAPMVDDLRSNPALFDRITFDELSLLEGDTGGRVIMGHFEHAWLPWLDKRLLMDIDTPEDLEKCIHAV